jgi:hypothetical protein
MNDVSSSNPAWSTSASPPPPPRNVLKWVLLGCGTVILLGVLCVVTLLVLIFGSIRSSQVVRMAVAQAERNPEVQRTLGTPLKVGWFISGDFHTTGSTGTANASIPVHGPRGSGTIYLVARKSAGQWTFERLEIELPGHSERVNLMQPVPFQAHNKPSSNYAKPLTQPRSPFTANSRRFSRLR